MKIFLQTKDMTTNLALDTISKDKQTIIFVNSKRSAEAQAEKIAEKITNIELKDLSEKVLHTLTNPTKQCERLAKIINRGIAFHHAGLPYQQRELIEENFRNNKIKVICATPTLAQGLDLPAFRVIIRDLKRFSKRGMKGILVLEYEQMSGRAGRPGKEDFGEAICIAKSAKELKTIKEEYLDGVPENIYSKLGVEPVLRTYILSLIASGFVNDEEELFEFFDNSFYAEQYGDMKQLHHIIKKVVLMLKKWNFIKENKKVKNEKTDNSGFVSALKLSKKEIFSGELKTTIIGEKVAELYLDPLTANQLIEQINYANKYENIGVFSILYMISSTLEIRPLSNVRISEYDDIIESTLRFIEELFVEIPDQYDEEYEDFVKELKQTLIFYEWMEEIGEDKILERYNVRPGELNAKKDLADWILYSGVELAKLTKNQNIIKDLNKIRQRLKYGVREELLTLLKLKNIGKIRARKLYNNGLKNLKNLKNIDINTLTKIIGTGIAKDIKKQLGQKIEEEIKELKDYKNKKKELR